MKWKRNALLLLVSLMVVLSACAKKETEAPAKGTETPKQTLTDVKVVLDWTPNTNHTGLYVALDQGYFEQEGLNVEIIQPGTNGSDAMVAADSAEFGVGVQEGITLARIQGLPIVSIAAIIQHNTSGFASPLAKNIKSPKDFEGKTYGGYGAPAENAVIDSLMQIENADVNKVKFVNIGEADYFTAVKRDIDFAWIYYAWTGVDAELRNEPLNMVYLTDYTDKLDYYTPVLTTSEKMVKEKPEIVKAFIAAAAKGYNYAIEKPEDAANLLLKAVPDLDKELVIASQKWLSPKYKDDAAQWGIQKREVWDNYATWMLDHKLLEKALDVDAAFTNDFLPESK
ncbi:ABC transporter substrate-binding protein [Paenibacillus eucommiae]|uniref:ABC-type nitrate/sulfonate/bicarbonate transport system substrate-binding protein n=1 Tax=Paenibacillus eucommiae TaxID=1355755 RepID=A0ABS4J7S3_9BACL|nr:ABC transporter substrate-binding protein [Paenibacillus eucommiae]MBP1995296.1 ABC-type nitrate/sulfonate/bicarbonate transport system substrate-binding protein [Paenibacillus eucommiae]